MRQQLVDLNEVQKIDLLIRELHNRKSGISTELRELEVKVASICTEIETLSTQQGGFAQELRVIESSVHAENDKIRKWERRLADIRNQREYIALNREVEGSKRAVRASEEQALEIMVKKEECDERLETLQDQLAENEVDCEAERARVVSAEKAITLEMDSEQARREKLVPGIKASLMRRYEAVRAKRLGVGLIAVADGSCQGCNMRLPPQLYILLQRGDNLEQCPSCQRIMVFSGFLPEEENAMPTPEADTATENTANVKI